MASETTDANAAEVSSTSAEGAQSTQTTAATEQPQTLSSVISQAFKDATAKKPGSATEQTAESDIGKSNTTDSNTQVEGEEHKEGEEGKDSPEEVETEEKGNEGDEKTEEQNGEEGEQEEQAEETTEVIDDKRLDKIPRFQQVLKEKNEYQAKVKTLEPLARDHQSVLDYSKQHNITPEQFRGGMEMLALLNTNPLKAKELLAPIWTKLQALSGDVLPKDLQEDLDNGVITQARAKEIATLRAQRQVDTNRTQLTTQQQRQQQLEQFQQQMHTSLQAWDSSTRAKDPDFAPKASQTDTDGKYELWLRDLDSQIRATPPRSQAEMTTLANKSYSNITKVLSRFTPRKPGNNRLSSTQSSPQPNGQPKTLADAIQRTARRHGVGG